MMTKHFSRPSWADELGINMDELRAEHPYHPDQLRNHKRITKRSEEYWAREARLNSLAEYSPETILDTPTLPVVKTPRKPYRVKNYEFTEAQLEIARRSLDAGGSV